MSEKVARDDWRYRCERAWSRVREAVYGAIDAVLVRPPPDVIEQIEDFMGLARCDFKQEKETVKCRDAVKEKQ